MEALSTDGSVDGDDGGEMIQNGWYHCPACGKKLIKIPADGMMFGIPVYCRPCKVEWFPTIFQGKEFSEDEPFPGKELD